MTMEHPIPKPSSRVHGDGCSLATGDGSEGEGESSSTQNRVLSEDGRGRDIGCVMKSAIVYEHNAQCSPEVFARGRKTGMCRKNTDREGYEIRSIIAAGLIWGSHRVSRNVHRTANSPGRRDKHADHMERSGRPLPATYR